MVDEGRRRVTLSESEVPTPSRYKCTGKYSRRKPHAELNVSGRSRNGGDRSAG
jgi:hypothetical protein